MTDIALEGFKVWARHLKSEEGIDYAAKGREVIQVMADGYCLAKDTNDEPRKNMYIAGLMLRFWYAVGRLQSRSPIPGTTHDDFVSWLYEAIEYACKYRAWQNPAKNTNAQQCINQCIETIRVQKYYLLNLQKNKANMNLYSLDLELDEDNDATRLDLLVDEEQERQVELRDSSDAAYRLIQGCINKKRIVEAIILDTIAFNDAQKVVRKTVETVDAEGNIVKQTQKASEFWSYRAVQLLSNLPVDYAAYFKEHYHVLEPELEAAITAIRTANNQKLYRYLRRSLDWAKEIYQPA